MANKCWLTKRIKLDGRWMKRTPVVGANGVLTDKVEHNGTKIHAPGIFVLQWHDEHGVRRYRPVGEVPKDAALQLRTQQARLEGVSVVEELGSAGEGLLQLGVDEFLEETKIKRAHKTWLAYKRALEMLVESCGVTYTKQLTRHILVVKFIKAMKQAGLGDRTQNNLFGAVVTFLHSQGHEIVTRADSPKFTASMPERYSAEELNALFAACNPPERLLFQFFLNTGCREQEVMYATWKDLDLKAGTFSVTAKPQYGFRPKDYEERCIKIPATLVRDLKARQVVSKSPLIFPNVQGRPNGHLLRDLKAVALRGELNCGHCESTDEGKKVICRTHPVCDKFKLHKFRHTFACWHLLSGLDVRTVQQWLGHSDLETTAIYLRAISGERKGLQQQVDATFADIRPTPMREAREALIQ